MQTNLERWLAVPLGQANMVAAVTALTAMAIVITFDEPNPEGGGTLLRGRALIVAIVHALFHWLSLRTLKAMAESQADEVAPVLAIYRDPRRISHLDLAAAWFGLFAIAPLIAGGQGGP